MKYIVWFMCVKKPEQNIPMSSAASTTDQYQTESRNDTQQFSRMPCPPPRQLRTCHARMSPELHLRRKQPLRRPHPCWETLESDINRRHTTAPQELVLCEPQYRQCDPEEHVEAVDEEDVPYSEECLYSQSYQHQ
jgi:hypothetical protein